MCAMSRHVGLTNEEHTEKIKLAKELVESGIMLNNEGSYDFINIADSKYFLDIIKNFKYV